MLYARASEYLTTAHAATALPPAETLDPAVEQPTPVPDPPEGESVPTPTPLTVAPAPTPQPGE
ncbi:MAG TPA: hypothetical protein DCZ72_01905 [Armatimonadetes bacterium]|nr:hypothetical protein [Armatimonadota bacterium]